MSEYKYYRKKKLQLIRPYIPGEDMQGISVSKNEVPTKGGMIGAEGKDKWYIPEAFFLENYEAL